MFPRAQKRNFVRKLFFGSEIGLKSALVSVNEEGMEEWEIPGMTGDDRTVFINFLCLCALSTVNEEGMEEWEIPGMTGDDRTIFINFLCLRR